MGTEDQWRHRTDSSMKADGCIASEGGCVWWLCDCIMVGGLFPQCCRCKRSRIWAPGVPQSRRTMSSRLQ